MPVEFHIPKSRKSPIRPSNVYRRARMHVKAGRWRFRRPDIRVVRSPIVLSEDEFIQHLLSLHIVILPYHVPNYAHRGSGIVFDSVLAERPLVFTRGIGMQEYLSFGNAVAASTPAEFASGIISILNSPKEVRSACQRARLFAEEKLEKSAGFLKAL